MSKDSHQHPQPDTSGSRSALPRVLRVLWRSAAAVVVLFLVALVMLTITLSTRSGSQWVLARVTDALNTANQRFEYLNAEGTF